MEDIGKADTIVGFIASDSGSDREVLCLSRLFLGTLLYLNISSVISAYNLACISIGFEAETFNFFLYKKKMRSTDPPCEPPGRQCQTSNFLSMALEKMYLKHNV